MTEVKLRIYEFKLFSKAHEYHAEIQAYSKSYSYSDEGRETSVVLNKDGLEGYVLVATFELGFTDLWEYEFEYFTKYMKEDYRTENYHLFRHNCRHYAFDLLKVLKPTRGFIGVQILQRIYFREYIRGILLIGIMISFGLCILPKVFKDYLLILILILLYRQ